MFSVPAAGYFSSLHYELYFFRLKTSICYILRWFSAFTQATTSPSPSRICIKAALLCFCPLLSSRMKKMAVSPPQTISQQAQSCSTHCLAVWSIGHLYICSRLKNMLTLSPLCLQFDLLILDFSLLVLLTGSA